MTLTSILDNAVSFIDNATSFIMDPSNDDRKPLTQGIAWVTTIILGIGTVGSVHGLSALWRHLRHIEKNETHEKMGRLFKMYVSSDNGNQPAAKETLTQTLADIDTSLKTKNLSPLQKVAHNVYDKREELWNAAMSEAQGDSEGSMIIFINKIRDNFKKENLSLSGVSNDSDALNSLFQSRRLRVALVNYARVNNLNDLLNKHLIFLAQNIYEYRDRYTTEAANKADGGLSNLLAILTSLIRGSFRSEGRSLMEIFNNKEALEIFKKSSRLMVVLSLYAKSMEASQQEPSREISQSEFENKAVEEALRLGRDNAQGPGLVTRVGLKEFQSNEEQLRQGIRRFLQLNHPDRNPDRDEKLVQDATQLLDMLKNGVYGVYREELDKHRNQNPSNSLQGKVR